MKWFSRILTVAACSVFVHAVAAAPATQKPNIIVILGDDIGYGDFGCYGATKVKTPAIDKVASQGLRFTDAHAASAVCTPSRYALLTGQYAWRNPAGDHILPGNAPLSIKPGTTTLPSILKNAGYKTSVVGKWHLGLADSAPDWNIEIKPGPLEIGFDECFILPATGDRAPCVYLKDHRIVNLDPKDPITVDYEHCIPGHANVIAGIGRIGNMTGGKSALWKDDEIAETLTSQAVQFIERNRNQPFFLYLATHDIHVPRVPANRFRHSSGAGPRGDVIQEFDWTVSEVVKALDKLNIATNTLLIVSSDNGGILDYGDTRERDGDEKSNNGHAFNGPLRGTKGTPYEGGTRIPLIMRWPAKIKPGTTDQLVCLVDTLATCAALTKQKLPPTSAPDSFSLLPIVNGDLKIAVRNTLIEHSRRMGVREGNWKLVTPNHGSKGKQAAGVELYNLANDLGEKDNVASANPEKVKELTDILRRAHQEGHTRP